MSKAGKINIGTCGFGMTQDQYAELFSCVEVQHTFYQPPMVKTLERWKAERSKEFEYTLKAWQLITHTSHSPTQKRLSKRITEAQKEEAGSFRPTETVKEAWEVTLASAKALKAKTILFQCPASFNQTPENIANLKNFFTEAANPQRGKLNFCWEPRGPWDDHAIKDICDELDLWHVVDPFKRRTVTPQRVYFRLHGIGGWRYKYEEGELEELASLLPKNKLSYVFFNNREMIEDAQRFQEIVKQVL
jgi:uncharacterized protein YecE (DUF72 family)